MINLNCDSKTKDIIMHQLEPILIKYADVIDRDEFDELYEKLGAEEDVAGIVISSLTALMDSNLNKSLYSQLHNIPDFFLTCTDIQNFTVPEGCQVIGKEAFCHCKDLITISLPKSLKEIKENAFAD